MKHISEEQMTLYYYGEPEAAKPVARHLESCPTCRSEYEGLRATLALLENWHIPEPHPGYEDRLWQRLQAGIEPRPNRRRWFLARGFPPSLRLAGALCLLALAFLAGLYWRAAKPVETETIQPFQRRLLQSSLEEHLERGELFLTEYFHAGQSGDMDPVFQKAWARRLSNSNRLFRQAALHQGDHEISALLDSLEIVLLGSLHQTGESGDEELLAECGELIFKIRVIGARLRKSSAPPQPPHPAIQI